MAVTEKDLAEFNRFADEKISNGGADSLRDLLTEWEERQQANAAIRRGIADIDAGRSEPFFESQDSFRQKQGLSPRK